MQRSGPHLLGSAAALAQAADAERVVPLGKARAGFISHQIAVIELRCLNAQSAKKQDLARGGLQQVGATDYFGDSHRMVIGNDCELIRGYIVSAPDYKIAEVTAGNISLWAKMQIVKHNLFSIRDTESPIYAFGFVEIFGIRPRTAFSRIDRLVVSIVGSSRGNRQVFTAARARKYAALVA